MINQSVRIIGTTTGYKGGWTRNPTHNYVHGLVDPWGRSYLLVVDINYDDSVYRGGYYMGAWHNKRIHMNGRVGLISHGPDGRDTTSDDIASWN